MKSDGDSEGEIQGDQGGTYKKVERVHEGGKKEEQYEVQDGVQDDQLSDFQQDLRMKVEKKDQKEQDEVKKNGSEATGPVKVTPGKGGRGVSKHFP